MVDDYEVGFKRPPKHAQFKKGQSGNSKGRPKGTKNLKTDLVEELEERVLIKEGSSQRKITKQRAMVKSLMARSIKGDTRAMLLIYNMMQRLLDLDDSGNADQPLTDDEQAVLETLEADIMRRVKQHQKASSNTGDADCEGGKSDGDD